MKPNKKTSQIFDKELSNILRGFIRIQKNLKFQDSIKKYSVSDSF